jgi:hypothetical protein
MSVVSQPASVAAPHPHDHAHAHSNAHGYAPVYVLAPVAPTDPFSRFFVRVFSRVPAWGMPVAILVCFLGGVGYVLYADPTDSGAFSSPTCLVRLTTGFDCPGCGGTRAFWYLLHGNVPAAARSHLMAVFAAPFLAYAFLTWLSRTAFGWNLPALRVSPKAVTIFLGAWAVFTFLRNLPWAPFTLFFV